MEEVTVIVLNHNGQGYLKDCFTSLKKQTYPAFNVIMVDDLSTDDSISFVKENFSWVKILRNKHKLGPCLSFNNAVREANTELIVKLDNDVVLSEDWLSTMVLVIKTDLKIAVVGSKILDYDSNTVQDIGSNIDKFGYMMNYYELEGLNDDGPKIKEVFYTSACSILLRRSVFEGAGMIDSKYFIYKDDLDLCWRLKVLGYKIVTSLDSEVQHRSGVNLGGKIALDEKGKYRTTVRKRYFGERNTLRTLLKNYSGKTLATVLPGYFFIYLAEVLLFAVLGRFEVVKAYFSALWWNVTNISDTWLEHKKIQKRRQVLDKEIMRGMIKGSAKFRFLKALGVPRFE